MKSGITNEAAMIREAAPEMSGSRRSSLSALMTSQDDLARDMELRILDMKGII